MSQTEYSFLDYTVMPFLRKRVISPDAAIVFSKDLSRVLWANAIGTRLFGGDQVIDLLEVRLSAQKPLIRQLINAASQLGADDAVVRTFSVTRGLKSENVRGELSRIALPDGEDALLLVCAQDEHGHRYREHELAELCVESLDGFADAAAIIDEYGLILASSRQFDAFEIDPITLEMLVKMVAREDDRLVKRAIQTGNGETIAAGLGRIRDFPARFIVVLADPNDSADSQLDDLDDDRGELEGFDAVVGVPEGTGRDSTQAGSYASPPWEQSHESEMEMENRFGSDASDVFISDEPGDQHRDSARFGEYNHDERMLDDESMADLPWEEGYGAATSAGNEPAVNAVTEHDRDEVIFSANDDDDETDRRIDPQTPTGDNNGDAHFDRDAGDNGQESEAAPPSLLDRWYFTDGPASGSQEDIERSAEASSQAAAQATSTDAAPGAAPVRFAFSIDREGIIRSVSPELSEAVGIRSADIIGKNWAEIASERGFDENGMIAGLLAKADTWSGKCVLWPVDDTDMVVPIDLAALPAFDRERRFDGFRGFGIIRERDAVIDPEARGLKTDWIAGHAEPTVTDPRTDEWAEQHDKTDGFGGWKGADGIFADDLDEGEETTPGDEAPETGAEQPSEPEPDLSEPSRDVAHNVFHLPSYKKGVTPAREAAEREGENGEIEGDAGREDEGTGLNGREKRAFDEISRNLSDEEEAAAKASRSDDWERDAEDLALDDFGNEGGQELFETEPYDQPDSGEPYETGPAERGASLLGGSNSVIAGLDFPVLVYRAGDTLFANEALLEETGYDSLEELDAAGGIEAVLAASDEDEDFRASGTTMLRRKDGSRISVHSRLTKVEWDGVQALCLAFDATGTRRESERAPQKAALDMMRVSELENILETATDGLMIIDGEGRIESLNTSGEALFGKDQMDVVGKPFTSLFATESRGVLEAHLEELRAPGVAGVMNQGQEVIGIEARGRLIPLFALIGKIGSSDRFCAVLRDLTDWKKTEEELVEAKRKAETASDQKSEFLSRVSHEIREPLTSIIGFSDVMIEERFGRIDNPRYREYLKDINRSGIHVLDLVNDLLDISKIEAGKLELSYEAVDLNQLAAETVALLQPKANSKRIIIRTSLSRAVPKVVADARSIRQIILNLVSNAIHHSDRNSQVIVSSTYEETGEVALRVRDTGIGMSAEELKRALEPFSQLNDERGETSGGTGLGLPLTKALVEANRAYFELESTKGEGTIAHIQFPSQRVLAD